MRPRLLRFGFGRSRLFEAERLASKLPSAVGVMLRFDSCSAAKCIAMSEAKEGEEEDLRGDLGVEIMILSLSLSEPSREARADCDAGTGVPGVLKPVCASNRSGRPGDLRTARELDRTLARKGVEPGEGVWDRLSGGDSTESGVGPKGSLLASVWVEK